MVYPDSLARVAVDDSSFIFGSTGDGSASLTINGAPVQVAPNGAWLAWVPFVGDSVITFAIEARTTTDSARLVHRVRRAPRFRPANPDGLWVDSTSFAPVGRIWWPGGEYLPFSVRASEGASLALLLPGGTRVPLTAGSAATPVPEGLRAFDRDTQKLRRPIRADRYRAAVRGATIGDPGPLFGNGGGNGNGVPGQAAVLEAVRGSDTVRLRWPVRLALLDTVPAMVELDDDRPGRGDTDRITVGRAAPAGVYAWFFPAGTVAPVTGRMNGDFRIALGREGAAWVSAADVWLAPGAPLGPAVVGSVTLSPREDRVAARIPVGRRIPFRVDEEERALTLVLHGAVSDVNWLRYGPGDSLVALATTRQASADQLELRFDLSAPVWGYRTRWDGTDLLLDIRRPPGIDRKAPLRGRTIVVDAGHPPAGSIGPTGLTEAEANLAVALEVKRLLEGEGATVLMPRSGPGPVELWPRIRFAEEENADLLVSIHNNALPDGVNPFTNNGSSAFYNHPRALPLAREILSRLVARIGLRDLGVARGDLALVRPTWMPATLIEGLFMMVPEQESALRSEEGRAQYALAVVEGVTNFLRRRGM
ncbi:MAG: N-acetylmuramoyl-L-alanine amidase [Gemmatimonadales bacterium]|nr:N-acetylmuramoyl-L-alanine amidase [Gemmatimonadales bacterium]